MALPLALDRMLALTPADLAAGARMPTYRGPKETRRANQYLRNNGYPHHQWIHDSDVVLRRPVEKDEFGTTEHKVPGSNNVIYLQTTETELGPPIFGEVHNVWLLCSVDRGDFSWIPVTFGNGVPCTVIPYPTLNDSIEVIQLHRQARAEQKTADELMAEQDRKKNKELDEAVHELVENAETYGGEPGTNSRAVSFQNRPKTAVESVST